MTVTFEDTSYGKIEVNRATGEAYFFHDDYIAPVDAEGRFASMWGTPFQVFWPTFHPLKSLGDAHLSVTLPRSIGQAQVQV